MRYKTKTSILVLAALFLFVASQASNAQTYTGQATAAKVTVTALGQPVVSTGVADTGDLPKAGGNISLTSIGVGVAGVLNVGSSNVSTSGAGPLSTSTASINNINIGLLSNVITADVISATTQDSCPGEVASGSSTITNLQINGGVIAVDGTANQTVTIFLAGNPIGTLIINEQIVTPRSITVNALHLFLTDPLSLTTTDVVIASARSGINCAVPPAFDIYSGRGTGVRLRQFSILNGDVSTIISDTGPLPTSGGNINVSTTGAGLLPPLLTTGVVTSNTSGGLPGGNLDTSQSDSTVDNLGIDLLGGTVTIAATAVNSNTQCSCSLAAPTCTGDSILTDLAVTALGLPVNIVIDGSPNQVVNIPVLGLGNVTLIINEQISAGPGDITVNALRVEVNLTGLVATSITVAHSHSDIVCGILPSAASATLSGRVLDPRGRGISRARVTLFDGEGLLKTAMTNTFGYFKIRDVPAGKTYLVSVASKRYQYESQAISVEDDLAGIAFYPSGGIMQRRQVTPMKKGTALKGTALKGTALKGTALKGKDL